jgi:hypothetical protein
MPIGPEASTHTIVPDWNFVLQHDAGTINNSFYEISK